MAEQQIYTSIHSGQDIDAAVTAVQEGNVTGGSVAASELIAKTAAVTVVIADLGNTYVYDSASDVNFTIPNDTALALDADSNASFEVYQKSTGVVNIVGASGVTIRKWTGYPTPSQYVTQSIHHVGANEWAVK